MPRYEVRVTYETVMVVEAEQKAHIAQMRERILDAVAELTATTTTVPEMTISRSALDDDRPAQMVIAVQPTLTAVDEAE